MMEQSRLDDYSPAGAVRMENKSARRGRGRRREKIESESESLSNCTNESENENEESEEDKESGSERRFGKSSDRVEEFMD